jgi:calcineurin-like phosphoesterase family protein
VIFFSSDHHFFHQNIIRYSNRPFASIEEMNETMIENWNSVVTHEDDVYCLGDFSFAGRPVEVLSYRLNGNKKIVFGNHDPGHPHNRQYKQKVKTGHHNYWHEFYSRHGWEVLPINYVLDIPGLASFNLCHMPYDCYDARYQDYKMKDDGRWLIHGHTHSKERKLGRQLHVGVDAWSFTPVSVTQLAELMHD